MVAVITTSPFQKTGLHAIYWPVDQPKAVMGITHGFTEHSGRYTHVAEFLNKNDFAVTAYDLPGHGKTTGRCGHIKNYDLLLDSAQALLYFTKAQYPCLPVFLFGHLTSASPL